MLKKTAIAIDPALLAEIDKLASERGESRNAFIGIILSTAVKARRDREITRRLDALFADHEQRHSHRDGARALDRIGDDWSDERW